MKVALDVMGGDLGPPVIVRGALMARRELDHAPEIVLYGDNEAIRAVLSEEGESADVFEIIPCSENITMHDAPATAVRKKKDAPIVRGMMDIKAGRVQGIVSAGSTGAMVAGALVHLGRLHEVRRPAIATWFPGEGEGSVILDMGANSDNKPEDLAQFAVMGHLFAEALLRIENPRVGLLNIGEESSKGSELYIQAHQLMQAAPVNFVGNVEGRDIFQGKVDVVVCDGFTGNVVLKLAESMVSFLQKRLMARIQERTFRSLRDKMGALLMKPSLKDMRRDLDYAEHGGAPLLGVQGSVIICHGKSNERAIMNAIRTAGRIQELHTIERTEAMLGKLREKRVAL